MLGARVCVRCGLEHGRKTAVNSGRQLSSAPAVIIGGGERLTHNSREVSLGSGWTYTTLATKECKIQSGLPNLGYGE